MPLLPGLLSQHAAQQAASLPAPPSLQVVDDSSSNKMLLVMDYMEGGPVMTREGLGAPLLPAAGCRGCLERRWAVHGLLPRCLAGLVPVQPSSLV